MDDPCCPRCVDLLSWSRYKVAAVAELALSMQMQGRNCGPFGRFSELRGKSECTTRTPSCKTRIFANREVYFRSGGVVLAFAQFYVADFYTLTLSDSLYEQVSQSKKSYTRHARRATSSIPCHTSPGRVPFGGIRNKLYPSTSRFDCSRVDGK
jgi:hypothetical protein